MRISDWSSDVCSSDLRIVLYDKRGHGLSEVDKPPYSIADHVGDLAALLDDLAIEGAIVCGLSVGGLIAQGLTAPPPPPPPPPPPSPAAHPSELQSLMRILFAVFFLNKNILLVFSLIS